MHHAWVLDASPDLLRRGVFVRQVCTTCFADHDYPGPLGTGCGSRVPRTENEDESRLAFTTGLRAFVELPFTQRPKNSVKGPLRSQSCAELDVLQLSNHFFSAVQDQAAYACYRPSMAVK